jgi:hypothetical protein
MKKRLFQILDEMNLSDINNGTGNIAVSSTLISADKVKQGSKITMGADEKSMINLMNDKAIAVLVVINKEEYIKHREVKP